MRSDSITEEAHSPQMDAAFLEEEFGRQERVSKKKKTLKFSLRY